ncbi:RNAse R [Thiohalomonas denitrificans]|uniref:Ribonuclease R n=1 Tax=Thiohalomonas denitrificans TaxID=415747 RepID=A0A1G5PJW1_9GAMM|nr:RNAse R [Thiohalomonas denitrificans]
MAKRFSNKKDPHQTREARKYENPIPSREFIMDLLAEQGRPMARQQIAKALKLEGDEPLEALRRRLRAMERDGQLMQNRRGGYGLISKMDLVRGRVVGHADGFGFLIPDEGGEDLFLSPKEMHGALHGDRVVARVSGIDRRGRKEGTIVEVLEHGNTHVVGRYYVEGGVGFLIPDNKRINQDILVPLDQVYGAEFGQLVTVELIEYPTRYRQAIGRVIEILGDHMAPGMEVDLAIRAHGLPHEWSVLMDTEIAELPREVAEIDKEGRTDLRDMHLVTIDGEDAKDFDDAVFCEPRGDGWRLVVAIADVSHYVRPGGALDAEARVRGNSVYFPGRVIPMLPEALSNGLCSVNPDVDRLVMVCDMEVSARGKLEGYRFYPAVMRSHARLTYNKVAAMLVDNDRELREQYRHVVPDLENLYNVFHALHAERKRRGAIDFETTETRIVFGENKKIDCIVPVERNDAHRLIEECMLIANVATADFLSSSKLPSLYRVHPGPSLEKLERVREFLGELGLSLEGGDEPQPKDYGTLLDQVRGRSDAYLIQTVLLRSLAQAVYTPDNKGHFGLSYKAYAHFTSPIRRYPDLLVHRAIRHRLSNESAEEFHYSMEDMVLLGEHCSMTERRADDATRDATDWLKCEFMMDRVGDEYDGIITGVTGFGLFVTLDDIHAEGLVHVTALSNDYYHFDPAKHRLTGERTRRMYRLADKVRIRVLAVNLDERKIDFEMVEE